MVCNRVVNCGCHRFSEQFDCTVWFKSITEHIRIL